MACFGFAGMALDIRCVSMPAAFETATVLSDASARSCCSKAAVQLMDKQAGLEKFGMKW